MSFAKNEFQQLKWQLTQALKATLFVSRSILHPSVILRLIPWSLKGDKFVLLKPVSMSLSILFLAACKHV